MTFERDWTIKPGEMIREWIEETGLTVRSTAVACGRMDPRRLQRIIDGKQRITKEDAARLQAGTQIPASFWLRFERQYRADLGAGRHAAAALEQPDPATEGPTP